MKTKKTAGGMHVVGVGRGSGSGGSGTATSGERCSNIRRAVQQRWASGTVTSGERHSNVRRWARRAVPRRWRGGAPQASTWGGCARATHAHTCCMGATHRAQWMGRGASGQHAAMGTTRRATTVEGRGSRWHVGRLCTRHARAHMLWGVHCTCGVAYVWRHTVGVHRTCGTAWVRGVGAPSLACRCAWSLVTVMVVVVNAAWARRTVHSGGAGASRQHVGRLCTRHARAHMLHGCDAPCTVEGRGARGQHVAMGHDAPCHDSRGAGLKVARGAAVHAPRTRTHAVGGALHVWCSARVAPHCGGCIVRVVQHGCAVWAHRRWRAGARGRW